MIHNVAEDDEAVLDDIRRYLSYFPAERMVVPAAAAGRWTEATSEPRQTPELLDIVSRDNRRVYDMRAVLDVVFDRPDWFEVQPQYGKAIICALAHLGGHPGRGGGQPAAGAGRLHRRRRRGQGGALHHGGRLVPPADRLPRRQPRHAARQPLRAQRACCARGARMFAAQTAATTIKLHVTLRKAYGFGSMVMSLLGFDHQSATFAYPGATMGAMSAAALSRASHAGEDLTAKLRDAELQASYPVGRAHGIRRTHRSPRDA